MQLSSYQQAILDAVQLRLSQPDYEPLRGILIEALAGTGKSFILVEICRLLAEAETKPEEVRLVVFGNKNKSDLADKLVKKVGLPWKKSVSTLHSLSYEILREAFAVKKFNIQANKYKSLAQSKELIAYWNREGLKPVKVRGNLWTDYVNQHYRDKEKQEREQIINSWDAEFVELLDLLRLYCYAPTAENVTQLKQKHGLECPVIYPLISALSQCLTDGLTLAIEKSLIDYTDMSWVLWMERENILVTLGKWRNAFKCICVDECQDTDLLQLNILSLLVNPERNFLIAVGDRRQAVYSFRGCVSDGMDRFKSQFSCDSFDLPINYRCGRKHLELVRKIYPHIPIEPHPEAIEGEIKIVKADDFLKIFDDPTLSYMGVSRKNAPLIAAAIKLLAAGKACKIKDKAIGKRIVNLVESICKRVDKKYDALDFADNLKKYEAMEQERLAYDDDGERKLADLMDLLEAIKLLFDTHVPDSIDQWDEIINRLFDEANGVINLYSIHSGKGGEGDVAVILSAGDMPINHKKMTAEEKAQEHNLIYVALTRPHKTLAIVCDEPQKISWLPRDFFESAVEEPEPPPTEPETKEEKLTALGFCQTDVGEDDEPIEIYRGWKISLFIPNGGIIGITLEEPSGFLWHCATESFESPQLSYFNTEEHLSYARRAIDAAETSPGQLALPLEVSEVMEQSEASQVLEVMESFSKPIEEILPAEVDEEFAPPRIFELVEEEGDLAAVWGEVVEKIKPFGTMSLVYQHARLVDIKYDIDREGWSAKLEADNDLNFQMLKDKLPNIERAFLDAFGANTICRLKVSGNKANSEFSDCPPDWVRSEDELEFCNLLDQLQSLSKPRLRTVARELIDRLGPEIFQELLS